MQRPVQIVPPLCHVTENRHRASASAEEPTFFSLRLFGLFSAKTFWTEATKLPSCLRRTYGEPCLSREWTQMRSVHSRMSGEHFLDQGDRVAVCRFTPAHTGNIYPYFLNLVFSSVHPRTHGEHAFAWSSWYWIHGSSPHTRGTCRRFKFIIRPRRFIPAHTGNILRRC